MIRTPTLGDADLTTPGLTTFTDEHGNRLNVELDGFRDPATGEFFQRT